MVISKNWLKAGALFLILALLIVPLSAPALAAKADKPDSDTNTTQNITQAYTSDQPLQIGMIVGQDPKNKDKVEPLSSLHPSRMQGVVVPADASAVTIWGRSAENQVFVAKLGRYNVLVSDQNGPITAGDYITISSLDGVGMKSDNGGEMIIGKAVGSFDGSKNVLSSDKTEGQQINIGMMPVDLGISHNPLNTSTHQIFGFTFLQEVARTLTGKTVSPAKIYSALGVFIIIALIAGSVLYAGIRGKMIATGRNPLAKVAINRSLFEVVLVAVVIFIIGLGAIYLILKL